ncbi:MAG: DUF58 domain-containing protein [Haliea sp.]|uniref:DUF58 domain-containing protein n=1 Tax=Haliea sp. TaxID=1932666 RepID=UPI000C4E04AC|nr:DUF58 domain-containing protein [Haliea sp.]MBM68392.1 DUF58 domain-containing protein [Haliea sp.]
MSIADATGPATGAYATLDALIALRFPAAHLSLSRRTRALAALTGPNKANFRGRGIDFEEVRNYQAGDDIRTIDWRVTARTGSAHTRVFREERERPVLVVIDQRQHLFFGSHCCFKSVLAAHLAGLLAWSALGNGDRVGGVVFNEAAHQEVRPRRSRKTVLALLSHIVEFNAQLPDIGSQQPARGLATMLETLRHIARPGTSVYLISDFHDAAEPAVREHLFRLAQHTEITAIACSDPLESMLPPPGRYAVTDGSRRAELVTSDRQLRERYSALAADRAAGLQTELQRLGIPLLAASTDNSPFHLLQRYFGEPRA